jgi:hypothetical protein
LSGYAAHLFSFQGEKERELLIPN